MAKRDEITRLLKACSGGDRASFDRLIPLIYDRLKDVARARLRAEDPAHTLNTTGLVHEAYLKLVHVRDVDWQDRAHFMAIASRTMRQILIDAARHRKAAKRGAGEKAMPITEDLPISDSYSETLLDLDDALQRLEMHHFRAAEVLQHRYFAGYTNDDIAQMLGISLSTVERELRFARAWLGRDWHAATNIAEARSNGS
ncbi:MAG: sigma-70 family RNA polymerase sigma factor [Rhodothermales bacterium]|nr:sigma-70 family RNA polymerase sigma factor [Rhodothermales bacterium]